jgi:hypothetical protein
MASEGLDSQITWRCTTVTLKFLGACRVSLLHLPDKMEPRFVCIQYKGSFGDLLDL